MIVEEMFRWMDTYPIDDIELHDQYSPFMDKEVHPRFLVPIHSFKLIMLHDHLRAKFPNASIPKLKNKHAAPFYFITMIFRNQYFAEQMCTGVAAAMEYKRNAARKASQLTAN
jgi:hypothetical protein